MVAVIRPSFTIREHAPAAAMGTPLTLPAVPSQSGLSFSYVFLGPRSVAVSLSRIERRGEEQSGEKFDEGGPTKRSKHIEREGNREKESPRFAPYFYDWPPHKHSLSYGLFALPKLGFRGALSAIHHPNISTERALWDSKKSLSLSFSFLLHISTSS